MCNGLIIVGPLAPLVWLKYRFPYGAYNNVNSIKTFQEQNKYMYIFFAFFGIYIPDLSVIIHSKCFIYYSRIVGLVPVCLGFANALHIVFLLINQENSPLATLSLLRKSWIVIFYSSKLLFSTVYTVRLTKVFRIWNEERCYDHYANMRQSILLANMKKLYPFYFALFFNFVLIPQSFSFRAYINPYGATAFSMWVPHELDDPMHFYYLGIYALLLQILYIGAPGFLIICFQLLLLISTELECLTTSLKEIVESLPIDQLGTVKMDIKNKPCSATIRNELNNWIATHIRSMEFIQEILDFLSLENATKYIFSGIYFTLVALSSLLLIKLGHTVDALIIIAFALGSSYIQYSTTRLSDDIELQSQNLFDAAYSKQWYSHPIEIQKMLLTISLRSSKRPVKLYFMRSFQDNTTTYLAMLTMAYKAYSVLLHTE